jgi:hypothetical protein
VRKPHIAYDQVHFLNTFATGPVAAMKYTNYT